MKTVPLSGLVLPVMMSISVVLPAPFGPIKQRSSPLSRINVRSVMALKPSKLTLTLSTTRTACRLPTTAARRSGSTKRGRTDQRLPLLSPGLGSGPALGSSRDRASRNYSRQMIPTLALPLQATESARNAVREKERDCDEQQAEHVQPGVGHGGGEEATQPIDDEGAQNRPEQRGTPADRHPNPHLDRVSRLHLARIDDADLWHVQRPRQPAQDRAQRPSEELVASWVEADEHGATLGVANRTQHAPRLGGHDVATEQVGEEQRQRRQDVQHDLRRGLMQIVAVDRFEVGQPVVATEAGLVSEEQQHQGIGQRLSDDRKVDAADAGSEREVAERESEQ